MAEYDGSIRINTEIDTKKASSQLLTLQNRIMKAADKVSSLRSKMDSLRNAKIPTQEYQEITAQIEKAEQKFNRLLEKQEQMQREGKDNGTSWQRLNDQMDEIRNEIRYAKGDLQDLVETGKAFTIGSSTDEFSKLSQQLKYAENDLTSLNQKHEELSLKQIKTADSSKNLGNTIRKSFDSIGSCLRKANSFVDSFAKRMKNIVQRILPSFRKETERSNTAMSKFGSRLKSLLSGIFIFNVISAGFRNMFSGIEKGFANFYAQNNAFKASVDSLNSRLLQLKNTFASAFAPIVQIAIPYIETLVSYLTKAANAVAQLIAALLGKGSYTRAISSGVGSIENASSAMEDLKDSAEDAEKAMNNILSPLDELNKIESEKEIKIDTGKEASGDGITDMFEEVPVDSYFKDMADKIKNVLSKIFEPLKKAWDREGKFVMDSWKFALKEIGSLIKDIGRDFLTVWQQDKTVDMFSDILHIIGDIGLIVGNLAKNFREAWNENQTGLHILENIRDIFAVIIKNIREAADYTVEWAKNLNFSPLLEAFERLTESLIPVVDNLSGVITDFYEQVLLPLGKWTLEKGLPDLLDVLTKFNEKVKWDELRQSLSDFWDALEPFAETVGEGLIIFIDRCANALANFLNSQEFKNFLDMVADWMSKVKPEDVADGLESIVKALIGLKTALIAFSAVKSVTGVFDTIIRFLSFFGIGGAGAGAAKGIGEVSTAIGGLKTALGALAALGIVEVAKDPIIELGEAAGMSAKDADYMKERYNGLSGDLNLVKDTASILTNGIQGLGWEMSNQLGATGALETAMNNIADGMIYTDEKLSKLQKNFGLTDEDIEMLRQSMLNMHPELRSIADTFVGLSDASVQTLQDIHDGFDVLSKTTGDYSFELEMMTGNQSAMTDEAKNFFMAMQEGTDYLAYYQSAMENTSGAVNTFDEGIQSASENIQVSSENIGNSVSEGTDQAKKSTDDACVGIKESVDSNLSETDDNVSKKLGSIKSTWFDVFESLKSKVASVFDSISSKITSVVDSVKSKIEELKGKMSGGFTYGGSGNTGYSIVRSVSLSNLKVPGYANGQVIPRTMKEHLARLGDNNKETEVVSPLSTIKQALKEANMEMGKTSGSGSIIIKLYLDGREVLETIVDAAKLEQISSGNNVFNLT